MEDDYHKKFGHIYNRSADYLPADQLAQGGLYWIMARNASVGIWCGWETGFLIPRHKLGRDYLFLEEHWDRTSDEGVGYGTVKAFKLIETPPFDLGSCFLQLGHKSTKFKWTNDLNESELGRNLLAYMQAKSKTYDLKGLVCTLSSQRG